MNGKAKVIIKNLPVTFNPRITPYVVARLVNGEFWYYTEWSDMEVAKRAASEFPNACVLTITE